MFKNTREKEARSTETLPDGEALERFRQLTPEQREQVMQEMTAEP